MIQQLIVYYERSLSLESTFWQYTGMKNLIIRNIQAKVFCHISPLRLTWTWITIYSCMCCLLFFPILWSEVDLGLKAVDYYHKALSAVNYYHKALYLGCCSSPRSASDSLIRKPSKNVECSFCVWNLMYGVVMRNCQWLKVIFIRHPYTSCIF